MPCWSARYNRPCGIRGSRTSDANRDPTEVSVVANRHWPSVRMGRTTRPRHPAVLHSSHHLGPTLRSPTLALRHGRQHRWSNSSEEPLQHGAPITQRPVRSESGRVPRPGEAGIAPLPTLSTGGRRDGRRHVSFRSRAGGRGAAAPSPALFVVYAAATVSACEARRENHLKGEALDARIT